MLPRERRLTTELFDQTMASGKLFHSPIFTLAAMKAPPAAGKTALPKNRFAAVGAKKFFKTAVERNKIRRRVYAAMDRSFLDRIDGNFNKASFYCIIMAKPALLDLSKPQITAALVDIFVKSGIIK
jgi:ribonuclease P protein component